MNKITLQSLKIASETLRAANDSHDVLKLIVRIFLSLGFDRVRIWLVDEEKQEINGGKCSHLPDKIFCKIHASLKVKKTSPALIHALAAKKPFFDKRPNSFFKKLIGKLSGVTAKEIIELPMISGKKKLIGVINIDNAISNRPLDIKKIGALVPFVNHAAITLDHATLSEELARTNRNLEQKVIEATTKLQKKNIELEKLANYDLLSELPNRRHLENYLDDKFKKANAQKLLTLAIIDIDFLKQINDSKGHMAGDKLILTIGSILHKNKNIDFAARYAGDEFIVVLIQKTRLERQRIYNNILYKIKNKTGQSVSIGSVTYPNREISSMADLIRVADDALYHAKHTGRNRFVCALGKNKRIIPATQRKEELQKIETKGTIITDYLHQVIAINEVSECLRVYSTEKSILKKIAEIIYKKLFLKRVYIYIKDEDKEKITLTAAAGVETHLVKKLRQKPFAFCEKSLIMRAIREKKVVDIRNRRTVAKFAEFFNTKTALIVPLLGRNYVLGVIILDYSSDCYFKENDYRLFLTIGDQIENGITKLRATNKIEKFNRELKKEIATATQKLEQYSYSLEQKIDDNKNLRKKERRIHFEIISALVNSIEAKDVYTRGHSLRVASYACLLGAKIGLSDKQLLSLRYAGLLHDLGKVSIDQSILNKGTSLTKSEIKKIQQHPVLGVKIISSVSFLRTSARGILHHHERWDGKGYPDKLKGKKIPLNARILAIADAYDAMTSSRSYGHQMTENEVINELKASANKQFDPELIKASIKIIKKNKVKTPCSNF